MPRSATGSRPNKQTQEHRTMTIKTQDIAHDGLYGYVAQPETAGKSSVLIVPTIFGVNAFVRGFADTLARAGLTAAVCDLYSGLPLPANYEEALARARKLNDAMADDIEGRWLDHLQRGGTSLGMAGFCLGGRYVLIRAAQDQRIKACAAAYPSIDNPMLPHQSQDALSWRRALPARCMSASRVSIMWRAPRPIARSETHCSAAVPRRSSSTIPRPSMASCTARNRRPIRPRPPLPCRKWWRSSRRA